MAQTYNPHDIEAKWQAAWEQAIPAQPLDQPEKAKKYVLIEFPYPSGEGLHMGHLRPYVAGDLYSRYWRLKGQDVMYPMGWDAFGLPAENYAIKKGVHPRITTEKNISNVKRQVKSWGVSFDWAREVNTTDPSYYKWTQWLFLQFYKKGLAFESTGLINWCPKDKTGLANEEVINGKCERCGTEVEKKELRQWYLRITEYADKLLAGLENLPEWPEAVKLQQKNWIGKSTGARIHFGIAGRDEKITVFTTRPDTIFGATYVVLAPEHPLVETLAGSINNIEAVRAYAEEAATKQEQDRVAEGKNKTGIKFEGVMAVNPANGKELPIFVADYVLGNYGTGAIMAVPAHDVRDFEFAQKFGVDIKLVIQSDSVTEPLTEAYTGNGTLVNSDFLNGLSVADATEAIIAKLEHQGSGERATTYKLRDWVFSRQRYWGEPIPLIHCASCGIVPVPDDQLPVVLPQVEQYEPTGTGESPLATIDGWVNVPCPQCGGAGKRETNTMPQWAGSCWYYLRYTDPHNDTAFADPEKLKRWIPVDVYFGGMEHTTLHLLYSRFWHLFLYDLGLVPSPEPYTKRVPHGIILAADGEKMSKSRGNVINPDDIVGQYGADTVRMYEMFLGPYELSVSWNDQGVVGVRRFLDRLWAWAEAVAAAPGTDSVIVQKETAHLIKKIGEDIEAFRFNTAIAAFMEFLNSVKGEPVSGDTVVKVMTVLSPFAPHITAEIATWFGVENIHTQAWPEYDPALLVEAEITIAVSVNGKVRDTITVAADISEDDLKAQALAAPKVSAQLGEQKPQRIVVVPGKLVNIVL
jgi:leucyl-tRNA synthetase